MYTSHHNSFKKLFEQLGLPSTEEDIERFIKGHTLERSQAIESAPFWNKAQATFLQEALQEDSDWVEVVDQLSAELRN